MAKPWQGKTWWSTQVAGHSAPGTLSACCIPELEKLDFSTPPTDSSQVPCQESKTLSKKPWLGWQSATHALHCCPKPNRTDARLLHVSLSISGKACKLYRLDISGWSMTLVFVKITLAGWSHFWISFKTPKKGFLILRQAPLQSPEPVPWKSKAASNGFVLCWSRYPT